MKGKAVKTKIQPIEIELDREPVDGFPPIFAQREVGKDIKTERYPEGYEFQVGRVAIGPGADGKITLFPRSYGKIIAYDMNPDRKHKRKKLEVYTFSVRPDLDREALGASHSELVALYAASQAKELAELWEKLTG